MTFKFGDIAKVLTVSEENELKPRYDWKEHFGRALFGGELPKLSYADYKNQQEAKGLPCIDEKTFNEIILGQHNEPKPSSAV